MTRILHIQLLGDSHLIYGDTPLTTVNIPRLQSLLTYPVLHHHAPITSNLAFLLWPDSTEAQARTNLCQQFHLSRQALPEANYFPQLAHHSHLFPVRLWLKQLGDDQTEWRGQVQHVLSGQTRYFRDWATLVEVIVAMVSRLEGNEGISKFD